MSDHNKLNVFRDLIECQQNLCYCSFDKDGKLIDCNSPNELVLDELLTMFECKNYMLSHCSKHNAPLILTSPLGVFWVSVSDIEEEKYHTLGPVFLVDMSKESMQDILVTFDYSRSLRTELLNFLEFLPIISFTNMHQFALMLYYCVTGTRLKISDIIYQTNNETPDSSSAPQSNNDHLKSWMIEQELLRYVREGNIDYKKSPSVSILANAEGDGLQYHIGSSIKDRKNHHIAFISLCIRAAIEGGLTPDTAFTVGDHYIKSLETCRLITEFNAISISMYEDFIWRVYKYRTNTNLSTSIQSCCDYINMHIEEELSIEHLAVHVGYAKYYLTQKFKSEIGVSLPQYIKQAKIERAKQLLTTSDMSIEDIYHLLKFSSRSFFSDSFQKTTGISPAKYRAENRSF